MLQKASLISLLVGGLRIKTKTILLQKYSSANSNQIGRRWALFCAELYVVQNAPLRHKKSPFATSSPPTGPFLGHAKSESNSTVIQCTPPFLLHIFKSFILYTIFLGYSYILYLKLVLDCMLCIVPGENVV